MKAPALTRQIDAGAPSSLPRFLFQTKKVPESGERLVLDGTEPRIANCTIPRSDAGTILVEIIAFLIRKPLNHVTVIAKYS